MLDVRTTRDVELEQMCYPDGDDFWNTYHFLFEDSLPESEKDKDPSQGETELCRFYSRGTCRNGDNCQYRHSRSVIDKKAVVCKHWLRGLCKKGDLCDFLHEYRMDLMPECTFFSRYGKCNNSDCNFRHISPDEKLRECPWYAKGWCRHGPRCRHKHIKKLACANYLAGFCPDGPDCKFGHPKFESLPLSSNSGFDPNSERTDYKHRSSMMDRNRDPASDLNPNPMKKMRMSGAPGSIVCHKCNQAGHKAASCPYSSNNPNLNSSSSEDNSVNVSTLSSSSSNPSSIPNSNPAYSSSISTGPNHHHNPHSTAAYSSNHNGVPNLHSGTNTWRSNTRTTGPRPLESVTCFKCGQMGHYANKCNNPALHPNPNNPLKRPHGEMMGSNSNPLLNTNPNPNQRMNPNPNLRTNNPNPNPMNMMGVGMGMMGGGYGMPMMGGGMGVVGGMGVPMMGGYGVQGMWQGGTGYGMGGGGMDYNPLEPTT